MKHVWLVILHSSHEHTYTIRFDCTIGWKHWHKVPMNNIIWDKTQADIKYKHHNTILSNIESNQLIQCINKQRCFSLPFQKSEEKNVQWLDTYMSLSVCLFVWTEFLSAKINKISFTHELQAQMKSKKKINKFAKLIKHQIQTPARCRFHFVASAGRIWERKKMKMIEGIYMLPTIGALNTYYTFRSFEGANKSQM